MKYLFSILLLFLITYSSFAQKLEYSTLLIADSIKKDAKAVIRLDQSTLVVKSTEDISQKYKFAVTVFKPETGYNIIRLPYDSNNKLKNIKAAIYDPMGKLLKKIDKDDIRDYSTYDGFSVLSDNRQKIINAEWGTYPYTLEWEYEDQRMGSLRYDTWSFQSGYETGVERSEISVTMPPMINLQYRLMNAQFESTIQKDKDGNTTYYWAMKNLKPIPREPFSPDMDKIAPHLLISPDKFTYYKNNGTLSSWKEYGKFMYDINKGRDQISPVLTAKIKELTANCINDKEKIAVLYRFLQSENRYISVQLGLGGHQTFEASYVEKNKYGDCKALTNFMQSLLKEIGITAQTAAVRAGDEDGMATWQPMTDFVNDAFNHVILYVPKEDMWLECTSDNKPAGYLGGFTNHRYAMLYSPEGGELKKTPHLTADDNTQHSYINVTIDETGKASFSEKIVYKGTKHDDLLQVVPMKDAEITKKYFLRNHPLPDYDNLVLMPSLEKDRPEANITATATLPRYANKSGNRLFIPLNRFNSFTASNLGDKERIFPFVFDEEVSETDSITIQIPQGYTIESKPETATDLKNEFITYHSELQTLSPEKYLYIRQIRCEPTTLPANEINNLKAFFKKITLADNAKMVAVKK